MQFKELKLNEPIQKALCDKGYKVPTPIQKMSIPELLKGTDLLGCAQTGTGKTAAFALPILQGLEDNKIKRKRKRPIKALVLAPTRELAIQIGDSFKDYSKYLHFRTTVIFGGVSQRPQVNALGSGVDILVATPGRLLDLIKQGFIQLEEVEYFVLDEADFMLDMGMLPDVKRIIKYIPERRQTMFFSATMPPEIATLAERLLKDPLKVEVTPVSSTVDVIEQSVYYVNKKNKIKLLEELLQDEEIESALVFSRTKHGADRIVKVLDKSNILAEAIHGNKSQKRRQSVLKNFKEGDTRVLVATDIAARGIDVNGLSHVFNYDLPEVAEAYVHRIGRTGRAGREGVAISFCDHEEKRLLREIEKLIQRKTYVVEDHSFPLLEITLEEKQKEKIRKEKEKASRNRRKNSSGRNDNRRRRKPKGEGTPKQR